MHMRPISQHSSDARIRVDHHCSCVMVVIVFLLLVCFALDLILFGQRSQIAEEDLGR